jgi:cell division protein FtsL
MISLRPENVIRQLPWQLDSQAASGLLLILVIFSLVGWLYLTQASAVTTTSYQIDELRLELDHLQNQNTALTLEIARLSALSRIKTRSRELGFGPPTQINYLTVPDYPAPTGPEKPPALVGQSPISSPEHDPQVGSWWVYTLDTVSTWLADDPTR